MISVDLSPLQGEILGLAALGWVGTEWAVRVHIRARTSLRAWFSAEDRYSLFGILGAFLATYLIAISTNVLRLWIAPDWVFYVGIGALVVGVAVRAWALLVLGRFFSPAVRTSAEQRLVRMGPYRRVRHPAYTGMFRSWLGFTLAVLSPVGFLFALGAGGLALGYRIHVEESALLHRFGAEYQAYRAGTWRLVPFVI